MSDDRDIAARLHSALLPALTAFREDESLDPESTVRWVDWLIGGGKRGQAAFSRYTTAAATLFAKK